MEAGAYQISWTISARGQMRAIYDYICLDSGKEADKVLDKIESIVDRLGANPLRYPKDRYRRRNNGTYRAFEKYHCRIAYRVLKTEIRIVQVRHTSRKPRYY